MLVCGKDVTVEPYERDRHSRTVANIFRGKRSPSSSICPYDSEWHIFHLEGCTDNRCRLL